MTFAGHLRAMGNSFQAVCLALTLSLAPQVALAQVAAKASPVPAASPSPIAKPAQAPIAMPASNDTAVRAPDVAGNPASTTSGAASAAQQGSYTRMKPTPGVGMPVDGGITLQGQHSPLGEYARWIHNAVLLPIITVITLFVLLLLVWTVGRYNRRANPTPSRTSHNTLIEVAWTLLPVLILVGIAVPSIDLLAKQYRPAPAKALTIKATGNQWFWTYTYPDNGGFEVTSYMLNLPNSPTVNNGVREVGSDASDGPAHLEVDNRMVVPVGEPIRLQTTGADVIHSFAVPSLWFKLDAVPGRINEKVLFIDRPGVYYGQCSELCGAKHGYMPIAVEALPRAQFNAWVLTQSGGVIDHQPGAPGAAATDAASSPPSLPKADAAVGVGASAPDTIKPTQAAPNPNGSGKPTA